MSAFDEIFRRTPGDRFAVPVLPAYDPRIALPDREPPHNDEAEKSVLGSILLDNGALPEVLELLDVPDFYRADLQVVFQGIRDLYDIGTPVDAVTLAEILTKQGHFARIGGDELLTEIVEAVPTAANAKYYAGIVREKSDGRRLIDSLCEGINLSYSGQKTAAEVLEFVVNRVTSMKVEDLRKEETTVHPLPDRMAARAFHGALGEAVNRISPQTEACREAILGQLLVAMGSVIGPRPHWRVDGTTHRCNLYLCLVGPTGVARKGTSWDVARWLMAKVEPDWGDRPVLSGLTSGEGLIEHVRDNDGTLLAVESEFARLLSNASREHSSLSTVLRQAWDGPWLRNPTRNNPIETDSAYFSLIGHMTVSDLRAKLTQNDLENGMANRIMWMNVYRDGELPEGGDFDSVALALDPLIPELQKAVDHARIARAFDRPVKKTAAAKALWDELYRGPLSEVRTGNYAKVTVRGAPMMLRLALLYAVVDQSGAIDAPHIEAARAFWDYCDATAAHLFGDPEKDTDLARLMDALKGCPAGMTRTEINRRSFNGRLTPGKLDELLAQAQGSGLVIRGTRKTGSGSKGIWLYRETKG